MIVLRSEREIAVLREAGRITGIARRTARRLVRPGISTLELSQAVEEVIRAHGAEPNFLGYNGFPASICTSINDQVVHGIPGSRVLAEGDVVSVDLGAKWSGYHGDSAFTVALGDPPPRVAELIRVTEEALELAVAMCVPGRHLTDVSHAVESHVTAHGFGVVRDYVGHGIGRAMHEDPQLPNYGPPGQGPVLRRGMILAVEPMVTLGDPAVRVLDDGWTVVSVDGSVAAHFEHTVAVGDPPEVLTLEPADG
jgi:methionyl aminopeptidase